MMMECNNDMKWVCVSDVDAGEFCGIQGFRCSTSNNWEEWKRRRLRY